MPNAAIQVYLIRHGETQWARDGRHTGLTDIPLTDLGRQQARYLEPIFHSHPFQRILSSPLRRALETAELAGVGGRCERMNDLHEWDYGQYEGLTTPQIQQQVPGWSIWSHPCAGGETIDQVAQRAGRVISLVRSTPGDVALFAHGHFLRLLAACWLGLPPQFGRQLLLETSTLSILTMEGASAAIRTWNGPLLTAACAVPWSEAPK